MRESLMVNPWSPLPSPPSAEAGAAKAPTRRTPARRANGRRMPPSLPSRPRVHGRTAGRSAWREGHVAGLTPHPPHWSLPDPSRIVHHERMLRFMPVGDSMTIGSAGEHTWRYRMWEHLCETYGGPFALVGPRETLYDKATDAPVSYEYADPDFPRAHLAGWGEGWLHMAPLIGEAVLSCRADVLLVSLGLIDLGFYTNAEQTAENVPRFVTE